MKKIKLLLLIVSFSVSNHLFSQVAGFRKDNILLPEKLIISEQVPTDTLYVYKSDSIQPGIPHKPFFEITMDVNFLKGIAEKVLGGKLSAYDSDETDDFYPYTALQSKIPLSLDKIKRNLGQRTDTLIKMNDDGSSQYVVSQNEINFSDLSSINFIESWNLTTNPLAFQKVVYAIEPVRRYSTDDDSQEYRYHKAFRIFNEPNDIKKSTQKLVAKIRYEHFFDLDGPYRFNRFNEFVTDFMKQNDQDLNAFQKHSSDNSPFLNGLNQQVLIKTLFENAFSGNISVQDYYSSKTLTPQEVKSRVFPKQTVTIINSYGLPEDRTVENDLSYEIKSVIFIEEWYYDEESSYLEKKVVGIAPVRYFNEWGIENNQVVKREILFTISLK